MVALIQPGTSAVLIEHGLCPLSPLIEAVVSRNPLRPEIQAELEEKQTHWDASFRNGSGRNRSPFTLALLKLGDKLGRVRERYGGGGRELREPGERDVYAAHLIWEAGDDGSVGARNKGDFDAYPKIKSYRPHRF